MKTLMKLNFPIYKHSSILIMLMLLQYNNVFAQQTILDSINQQREKQTLTGLKLLSGWSASNIIYGSIARNNSTGSDKYFHEMNAIFNGVTLGISALGYFTAKKSTSLNLAQSLKKQNQAERLFLFNAGLDLAYIAGGAYIKEKSYNNLADADRLTGYGNSIMLQGAVLAVFDGVMYVLMRKNGKKLNAVIEKISFQKIGNGIGLAYTFK